jgi:protein-glutamine gamma-glutamyltransferase
MVPVRTVLEIFTTGIALLGYVPLFANLELLPRFALPAALVIRYLGERRRFATPASVTTGCSILLSLFYLYRFRAPSIAEPAVALLVALLAVRLLGERSPRNYLQVFALSVFCLAGSSLFDLSPVFLVYLGLLLLFIAASLVLLTFYGEEAGIALTRHGIKRVLTSALFMPVVSVPLILLFFTILPRTQFPLWNISGVGGRTTGFTERVEPGAAAALADRKTIAFRAEAPPLDRESLYWRAIVLNSYENGAWVRRDPPLAETDAPARGRLVDQVIYPEGDARFLPALSVPLQVTGVRSITSPDFVVTRGASGGKIRYRVRSLLAESLRVTRPFDTSLYVDAAGAPLRLTALGKSLAGKTPEDAIAAIESFYRSARIVYTRDNLPTGPDSLDSFLFQKKRGYCEYFASSCALLLRTAGVPARLVGGYYGGEYNEIGGYYIVTDEAAHVWVEALVPGKGWIPLDPSRWSANFSPGGAAAKRGLLHRLSLYADSLSYFWNVRVIGYDLEKQVSLVRNAGKRVSSFRLPQKRSPFFFAAGVVAVVAVVLIFGRRRGTSPVRSRERRLLESFSRRLKRRYGIAPGERGLFETTSGITDPAVQRFVSVYAGAVYRDRRLTPAEIRELKALIKTL